MEHSYATATLKAGVHVKIGQQRQADLVGAELLIPIAAVPRAALAGKTADEVAMELDVSPQLGPIAHR